MNYSSGPEFLPTHLLWLNCSVGEDIAAWIVISCDPYHFHHYFVHQFFSYSDHHLNLYAKGERLVATKTWLSKKLSELLNILWLSLHRQDIIHQVASSYVCTRVGRHFLSVFFRSHIYKSHLVCALLKMYPKFVTMFQQRMHDSRK